MKGIAGIAVLAAFLLVMGGIGWYATGGGTEFLAQLASIIQPASITSGGKTCDLLQPEWATFYCRQSGTAKVAAAPWYQCGLFNLHKCIDVSCSYADVSEAGIGSGKSPCTITCKASGGACFYGNEGTPLNYDNTRSLAYGSTVKLMDGNWEVSYPQKGLAYKDTSGREFALGPGCSNANILGTSEFNKLPDGAIKGELSPWDSPIQYVYRWQAYPYAGNTVKYPYGSATDALCVTSGTGGIIYSISIYNSEGGACYGYQGNQLATVACCPGQSDITNNRQCGQDFVWKFNQASTGCCQGGLCSDTKCSNGGLPMLEGSSKVQYSQCNSLTGQCTRSVLGAAECDPYKSQGCSGGSYCDPATWRCAAMPVTYVTCIQAGHECCSAGMFASNIGLRTCEQAGKSGYSCVDGRCVVLGPGTPPGGTTTNPWALIMKFMMYWIVATVLVFIILSVVVRLPIPALAIFRKLTGAGSWQQTLIISVVLGGLLSFMFTPFVASVASMVGVT